jgi:F420H(2)-dependent quinone reductase
VVDEAAAMSLPRRRAHFLTNDVANRVLVPLLRSPLGARLGRHLAVIEYAGRRTARPHRLVTQYARDGRTVRVTVGAAEHKTWWRNFRTPGRVHLRLAGEEHDATAHVVHDGQDCVVVALLDDPAA